MTVGQRNLIFRNGEVCIDPTARALHVNGQVAKIGNRAFDLLEALVERRERLVPKQELMDVVWPGLVVEENNLQVHVMTLRKLLGPDAIVTVSGRGYRFALTPDAEEGQRNARSEAASASVQARRPPAPSTLLIGREALSESICALVRRTDVRLITLTGPGGSGKTRVALHVTAQLAHDFADGSYIVMLAPVRDPAHVAPAVAAVLELQEAGNRSPEEMLIAYLRDRAALLTLDNFEHVLAAAPLITKLLDACPRIKVLVTSRAVLKLSAERDVVVPPLPLPDRQATAKGVSESSAVRLFIERARAVGQDIAASENDISIAAQICRRLDGLPLAIELAAARLRVLSPQALLVRLEHRLQLLKSGPNDLPERLQTLRGAIAWSYDLLERSQQTLFRRLSVFVGGWSMDAAAAVGGGGLTEPVFKLLAALVDQNLVQRIDDVNGEPRFTMLETVREFADEALQSSSEQSDVQQQHAVYYMELAEKLEPLLTSAQRKPYLTQLQAELNNFRAALTWLIRSQTDTWRALRLAGALPWMWYFAGQFREGRNWLKLALELKGTEQHTTAKAKALSGAARLAMYAGDPSMAIQLAEESVALWRQTADKRGLAFALFHLGIARTMKYQTMKDAGKQGELALRESLEIFHGLSDAWGVALATSYLGITVLFTVDSDRDARRLLLEGRARFSELEDTWGLGTSSHYLGSIALRQGDYVAARELTNEMLRGARELNDNYRVSRNLYQLAEIAFAERIYDEAIEHLNASLAMMREQGRIGDGAQLLRFMARLELELQHPDRAVRLFAAASPHASKERTFPSDDPAVNDSALNAARQLLGNRKYEMEWARGIAMSFDEAVSWVLAR